MDKYGVEEEKKDGTKTADEETTCPECGQEVEKHGNVKICPKDGSGPFEKKDDEQ